MSIPISSILRIACVVLGLAGSAAHGADLVVSAAASLTDAFKEAGRDFEAAHPGTHVVFNFGASDVLLRQIEQGAPADLFASADEATMDKAVAAGHIAAATRKDFAANALVLIVPTSAASAPNSVADLRNDSYKKIAIGNPDSVPAGRYAKQALVTAKLWDALEPKLVQAQNVRQALDYVARGEAEAGFVYATDAAMQAQKVRVALDMATATPVRYPIGAVAECAKKPTACDFEQFLLSARGQAILANNGFRPASP